MITPKMPSLKRLQAKKGTGERGFSLIEFMVAVAIGLMTVAVITSAYVQLSQSSSELGKANDQIENGRVAIQIIENDMVHAGYWGGFIPVFDDLSKSTVPSDAPTAVPDPCLTYASTNWDAAYKTNLLGINVQVYDNQSILTETSCSSVVGDIQPNTDVLIVRHADTCAAGLGNCPAFAAGNLYQQISYCATDPAPSYVLDTDQAILTRRQRNCMTAAELRKFKSSIYYVRSYYVTAGDGIPTLMRSNFKFDQGVLAHQGAEALIPGIEAFRIELGVDSLSRTGVSVDYDSAVAWADPSTKKVPTNRGDGAPDGDYVQCTAALPCTAVQLRDVVSARLHVLARSLQPSLGYTDPKTYHMGASSYGPYSGDAARYKRHVYTTTIRLKNISGRRETP